MSPELVEDMPSSISRILYFIIAAIYLLSIPALLYLGKITAADFITFLGIIPLGIIALYQEQLKSWFFAPDLQIEFKLEAPFCSKTPFSFGWENHLGKREYSTEAYYFRIGVKNIGKSQAKYCEVFLADLKEFKVESKKWEGVEYFQQVNLKWDRGKPQEDAFSFADINPSLIRYLSDVGHIYKIKNDLDKFNFNSEELKKITEGGRVFSLDFLYGIGGYQSRELHPNKKYKFTITVVSENAIPVSREFDLLWSGKWEDDPNNMFQEISIE